MPGFTLNEHINRSPEEVFAFISNLENASKIMESVVENIKLTEGPMRVGTRFRETRMMNGKEEQSELEVVAYEPGRGYAVQNATQGITSTYTYTLSPTNGGTDVTLVCDVTAGGVKKLMVPMVVAVLKKEDGDHLERLKQAMEAGT